MRLSLDVAQFWSGRATSPEYDSNYVRARDCRESLGDNRKMFPEFGGLWFGLQ